MYLDEGEAAGDRGQNLTPMVIGCMGLVRRESPSCESEHRAEVTSGISMVRVEITMPKRFQKPILLSIISAFAKDHGWMRRPKLQGHPAVASETAASADSAEEKDGPTGESPWRLHFRKGFLPLDRPQGMRQDTVAWQAIGAIFRGARYESTGLSDDRRSRSVFKGGQGHN